MGNVLDEKVVYYNANVRNKNVGDCTKRGLSLAFDMSYNEVSKELNALMHKNKTEIYNANRNIRDFLKHHGVTTKDHIEYYSFDDQPTVQEFTDAHKNDVYVLLVGKSDRSSTWEHLVTVYNGNIYDSWDSSNYHVRDAYRINTSIKDNDFREFSDDEYKSFLRYIVDTIDERYEYYSNYYDGRKMWDFKNIIFSYQKPDVDDVEDSSVDIELTAAYTGDMLNVFYGGELTKVVPYKFNIRLTDDQIKEEIYNKTDNAVKKFVWDICDAEKEASQYQDNYSYNSNRSKKYITFNDGFERRVFNALPTWAKVLAVDFESIGGHGYGVGERQDVEYRLEILKLANDTKHDDYVEFTGMSAKELTYMLNDYKKDPNNYDEYAW